MGISFVAIFVLLIFFGMIITSIVLIFMSRGKGNAYPSCGACGYDLSGTIGEERRCPECGVDFATAGILPPSGGRRTGMLFSGVVLLIVTLSCASAAIVLPVLTYRQANAARQQAVQQQQAAIAATQATDIQALKDKLARNTKNLADARARVTELQTGETQLSSDEVDDELAQLSKYIELLSIEVESTRAEIIEAEGETVDQTSDVADE